MKKVILMSMFIGLFSFGCSWSMVTKAPTKEYRDQVEYSECTKAPVAPIVDIALGAATTASSFYLYKNAPNPSFDTSGSIQKATQGAAVGIGVTSLFFYGSSAYGFLQVHQCNKFWKSKE